MQIKPAMRLITRFFLFLAFFFALGFPMSVFAQPSNTNFQYSGGDISTRLNGTQDSLIVTLELFYNCPTGIAIPGTASVIDTCTNSSIVLDLLIDEEISDLCAGTFPQCAGGIESERRLVYEGNVALSQFSACNEIAFIVFPLNRNDAENITNSAPGTDRLILRLRYYFSTDSLNSTPRFTANGNPYVCGGTDVVFDPLVIEEDGDSLVYSIATPLTGSPASPSSYSYNIGEFPISAGDSIDPLTGILTFTAPSDSGFYQIVIQVDEYDRTTGSILSTSRRDFQFFVDGGCSNDGPTPAASLSGVTNATLTSSYTVTIDTGSAASFSLAFTGDVGETVTLSTNALSVLNGASVSASVSSNTTTGTINWTPGAADVGTYYVTVGAEDNNCDIKGKGAERITVIVQESAGPFSIDNVQVDDETCAGADDGQITINTTGGVGPFGYYIVFFSGTLDTITQSSNVFSGLEPLSYNVYAIDSSDGTLDSATVSVSPGVNFIATGFNNILAACDDACNGRARANSLFGGNPKTYLWDDGATSQVNSALCGGLHSVTITEASNGCQLVQEIVIPDGPALFSVVDSTDSVSCNGGNDGAAFLTARGGYGASDSTTSYVIDQTENAYEPYPFNFSGATTYDESTFTSFGTGFPGGDEGLSAVINIGFSFEFFGTSYTQFRIHANGYITFDVANPTNSISFTQTAVPAAAYPNNWIGIWEDLDLTAGGSVESYEIGNGAQEAHVINFIDVPRFANNSQTQTFQIVLYETSNIIQIFADDVTVLSSVQGIEGSGGTSGLAVTGRNNANFTLTNDYVAFIPSSQSFTYNWSSIGSGNSATNLTADSYTVVISDPRSCDDTLQFNIEEPAQIVIDTTLTNPLCAGDSSGSITVSASGGNGAPFTYLWSTGATSTTINNLPAGTYTVTATDVNGCSDSLDITLVNPASVIATITVDSNVLCFGGSNGQLTASGSGGDGGPYTFLWTTGDNTPTITGLVAGTYGVTVTDGNGCQDTTSNVVSGPASAVSASITSFSNVLCPGDSTGSATAAGAGGTPPYTFLWPSGGTSPTESNLSAGSYIVTVTDNNGCSDTSEAVISEPANGVAITIASVTDVSCNGDNDGSITANAATGGTGPYIYLWSSGGSGLTEGSLSAGTYTITATDANGCEATADTVIAEPAVLAVDTTSTTDPTCSGSTDGSITININGGTPAYNTLWSTGDNTLTVTGLSAGTYSVTVTDNNGCQDSLSVTLSNGSGLTASINIDSAISCNGASDGQLTASSTNGTAPFNFAWTPPAGNVATVTGLSAGTYSVTITDVNGCSDSATQALIEPSAVTASITTSTDVSCNGGSDGSATAAGAGGTPPYSFAWSNGDTGPTTTSGLPAGGFIVTVTDANGCSDTAQVTIDQPLTGVTATATSTNVNCFGTNDGTATAVGSGGTTPYSFTWSTGDTAATITGLAAGSYIVTVEDDNGCTDIDTTTITGPALPLIATTSIIDSITCAGANDGVIFGFGFGGTAPYTYLWNTGDTIQTISGLGAGTYTVTVTDANGCTDADTRILTAPPSVIASIIDSGDVSCNGGNDGFAIGDAIGGTTPYSFLWSNGGNTDSIGGLTAGTYILTVTDSNGCQDSVSVVINEPLVLVASIASFTDALCIGDSSGTATATATGGTAPYDFAWPSGGTNATENNLAAGSYIVTVTDVNGCSDTALVNISQPAAGVTVGFTFTNVTCFGADDGTATASGIGGTPPYSYAWDNGDNTATTTGLSPGTYVVTVTDSNGCTGVDSVTITEPLLALIATTSIIDSITCVGANDGEIFGFGFGGTAPYTYLWNTGDTIQTLTNLSAGTYTVTVTDANGCEDADTRVLTAPPAVTLSFSSNDPSCAGATDGFIVVTPSGGTAPYSYLWSNAATADSIGGLTAGTYVVTVTDDNGCEAIDSVTLVNGVGVTASVTFNSPSCNGENTGFVIGSGIGGTLPFSYSWSFTASTNNFQTGLLAGTYTLTVTDGNSCEDDTTFTLIDPPALSVSIIDSLDPTCANNDGTAEALGAGGSGSLTYLWTTGDTTAAISGLAAGTYTVTVEDSLSCVDSVSVTLIAPTPPTASASALQFVTCATNDGEATVNVTNGTAPFSFNWTNGDTTQTITGLDTGTYTVTVTDVNNCTDTSQVTIIDTCACGWVATGVVVTNPICDGDSTGVATVTHPGATAPITYAWSNGSTNDSLIGVVAGTYQVTVTDVNGCVDTSEVSFTAPTAIVFTGFSSISQPTCDDACDGAATANATGGVGTLNYAWSSGSSSASASGLCGTGHTVTITDGNGCTIEETIALVEPPSIFAVVDSTSDALCNGDSSGTAFISAYGGFVSPTSTNEYIIDQTEGEFEPYPKGEPWNANSYQELVLNDDENSDTIEIFNGGSFSFFGQTKSVFSISSQGLIHFDVNQVNTGQVNGMYSTTNAIPFNGGNNDPRDFIAPYWSDLYPDTVPDGPVRTRIETYEIGTAPNRVRIINYIEIDHWDASTPPPPGDRSTFQIALYESSNIIQIHSDSLRSDGDNHVMGIENAAENVAYAVPGRNNTNFEADNDYVAFIPTTQNFTYTWSSVGSGSSSTTLPAGNYTVTVADGICTDTVQFTIDEPASAVAASIVSTTSPTCFGGDDGQAVASGSGGTGPYTFLWSNGATTDTANSLTAGPYTVTVTDANGCEATASTTISDGTAISVATTSSPSLCFVCSGQATATVSGGSTPYTYAWSTSTVVSSNSNSNTQSSLCSAPYSVTVTDANGCADSNSVNVSDIFAPPITATGTDASCDNTCDGQAVASYTCLTCIPTRWYAGTDTTTQIGTGDTITGLCAGTYLVRLTTGFNCNSFDTVIIGSPNPLILATDSTNASCSGGTTGSASVTVSGGTTPYSYLWSNNDTTSTITGLSAGNYSVTVTDGNGCTDSATVSVLAPSSLVATIIDSTDALCNGSADGTAEVQGTGGTLPYSFAWDNGESAAIAVNLDSGQHCVTITDDSGCTAVACVTIDDPAALTFAFTETPISCGGAGNDGEIDVAVSGGTTPYASFAWSNGGSGTNISGLTAGTYCVTVTDANGCPDSACYVLNPPGAFTVDIVDSADVLCFGDTNGFAVVQVSTGGSGTYTFLWDNGATTDTVNNLSPGPHSVTVTDVISSCVDSATVTIGTPTQLIAAIDSTVDNLCFNGTEGIAFGSASGGTPPYTLTWSNGDIGNSADSLPAGNVLLTVTDANGCTDTISATIGQPATGLTASAVINTNPLCDGDSASVTASGSGGSGVYSFLWPTGDTTATVLLPEGTYCVTVTDGGVCEDTACVTITDPDAITFTFNSTDPTCPDGSDGTITVTAGGGTPPYASYAWNTGATTPNIGGLEDGCYTVTITDANGCQDSATHCINDPASMVVNFSNINVSSCGTCNGSATANVTNGTAPYSYVWSNADTGMIGNGLCPGINGLTITDANGCVDSFNINVPTLDADTVTAVTLANVSCNGGNDGVGVATYVCTVAPCTVEWFDVATSTSQGTTDTITGLAAGDYYVQLTNDSGCVSFDTITITEPSAVVATITSSSDVSCLGGSDGSATVGGSGGTPGYTFEWPSGNTGATETGLSAGTYCVTVTDANDCEDTACVIIDEPATGLSVTAILISNVTCNNGNDGSVTASASGGAGPFTYTWNGTTVADTLFNQPAGTYIVVADNGGPCTATDTIEIIEPDPITGTFSNVTDPSCAGAVDGSATVTGAGGNGGYTYLWPSGNTNQTDTALADGTYCVTITDALGCSDTACVIITDPASINNSFTGITASSCTVCDGTATANPSGGNGGPFTFQWSNGQTSATNDSLCAGINSVTITDIAGCFIIENVLINADSADTVIAGGTNPNCGSCDGTVFATYNCTSAPCTVEWTNLGTSTVVGTTDTVENLCAGTYAVELTNGQGCVSVDSITIVAPDLIDPNATINDATCFGSCNGSISLATTGGSGSYTYTWDNGAGNVSNISSLCAGDYTVTIDDGNGCDTVITFTIDQPTEILANANVQNASCGGVCDGQVLVNPTGGEGTYSYNWNPTPNNGNGLNLADSLCAGTYFLTITDGDGCTRLDTFEITQPDLIVQDTVIVTDATCGVCDGSIDPTFSGGAGGFIYAWTTGSTNDSIAGLCFGFYEVTVTDVDGCSNIFGYPVSETNGPDINITSTNATASGNCDGTATVNVISSLGTVTYNWSNGDTTQTTTGLCAGFYIVTVTDTNGCSTVDTVTITEPDQLLLDFDVIEITCSGGGCDGSIEALVTGGVPPYTFAWSNGDTTALITGLCSGTYTVTVTDASAQVVIDSVILNDPQPFNIVSTLNMVSCPGECDGNISLNITGGAPPYSIIWNTGDTTSSIIDLCAGTYSVVISDTEGCSDSLVFDITEPAPIVVTVDSLTNPDCAINNGSITVTASGGNGGAYSYLWLDVTGAPLVPTQNTNIATNLGAGIYNVQVIDTNGCIDTANVILNNLNAPVITLDDIIDVSCFGECDGEILTTISGGTAPYTILWASGSTTDDADSLCAGDDTIAVVDANLCASFDIFTVGTPDEIQVRNIDVVDVTCGADCDGSIDVSITGGTEPYTFAWSNGGNDSTINDLCAGLYTLTVTDANDCEIIVPVNVGGPDSIRITLDSLNDATCTNTGDGGVFVTVTGGTAPLTYEWAANGDTISTEDLQGVLAGTYTLVVTDANGCSINRVFDIEAEFFVDVEAMDDIDVCPQSQDVRLTATNNGGTLVRWLNSNGTITGEGTSVRVNTVSDSNMFIVEGINGVCVDRDTVYVLWTDGPGIDAGPDKFMEPGESVTIGGSPTANPGVSLEWSPLKDITSVVAYNPEVNPLETTMYYVFGTDLDGCFALDSVLVTVEEVIDPVDGFSPNGDGVNDEFYIERIEDYPNAQVLIFNRWGNLIYEAPPGYVSDPWDGTYDGKELPIGSYYYVIDLKDDAIERLITGPVTILK